MKDWYIVIDGKPTGPHELAALQAFNIHPGTFVKTSGMDDYKEAHEIPELRKLLGFKRTATLPQYFATLDIRLLAVAIDYFLVSMACVFAALIGLLFIKEQVLSIVISVGALIVIPILKMIYAAVMESSPKMATYGKAWLGLKVCDETGQMISSGRAFGRNAAKILGVLTLGIGYLMGFFNKKQQCLHDQVAGTLVVKDRLM